MAEKGEFVIAIPLGGRLPEPGATIDLPSPSVSNVLYRVKVQKIKKVSWHRNRLEKGYPIIGVQLTVEGIRFPLGSKEERQEAAETPAADPVS